VPSLLGSGSVAQDRGVALRPEHAASDSPENEGWKKQSAGFCPISGTVLRMTPRRALKSSLLPSSLLLVTPLAFWACASDPEPAPQGGAGSAGMVSAGGSSGSSAGGTGGAGGNGGTGGSAAGMSSGGAGLGGSGKGGSSMGGATVAGGSAGDAPGGAGASAGSSSGGVSGAGTAGEGVGGAGNGAGGSGAGAGGTGGAPTSEPFSFFMTSQAGLARLAENPDGFGGDLRFGMADGLSGADEICRQLAEGSMPGNGKTWRAFLSVTEGPNGTPVDAIDRVGEGPWYDRLGRTVAMTKEDLLQVRPRGADPAIVDDLPNEDGVPNHDPGTGIIDNHNVLTGSTTQGTLDNQGLTATCQDWTSSESDGGRPRCGVSWPRASLLNWISVLNEGGCAPGATPPGAESGPRGTVGALGGYGGFYCFALTP
jgi:hypothetical protein